jgi:hypothetical protein
MTKRNGFTDPSLGFQWCVSGAGRWLARRALDGARYAKYQARVFGVLRERKEILALRPSARDDRVRRDGRPNRIQPI